MAAERETFRGNRIAQDLDHNDRNALVAADGDGLSAIVWVDGEESSTESIDDLVEDLRGELLYIRGGL